MRFAFVSPDFLSPTRSSIGIATALLGAALVTEGHTVLVVVVAGPGGTIVSGESGIEILPVRAAGRGRWGEIQFRRRIFAALQAARRRGPLHGVEVPDFQGLMPWRLSGTPVQVRLHNSVTSLCRFRGARGGWMTRFAEGRTLAAACRWVGASEFAFQRTEQVFGQEPPEKAVVPCPVRLEGGRSAGGSPDRPYIIFPGSLNWLKGGDIFVKAATIVRDGGLPHRFVALGGDPEEWASSSAGAVESLGWVGHEEAMRIVERAALVVSPSRLEFQGIAVAEAMARRVPVVVPRRAPFTEFYSGATVRMVDGVDPAAWANAIHEVVRAGSSATAMAEAGSRLVRERFDPARVAKEWLALWR